MTADTQPVVKRLIGIVLAVVAVAGIAGCSHEREDTEAWCHGGGAQVVEICESGCYYKGNPQTRWACVIEIHQGDQR